MFNQIRSIILSTTLLVLILGASVFLAGSVYAKKTVVVFDCFNAAWEPFVPYLKDNIAEYERLNPNVDIQMIGVGWGETKQSLMVRSAAGDAPDVMMLDADWYFDLGRYGALADLKNLATPEEFAEFDSQALESGKIGNAFYTLPNMLVPWGVWTNNDLLKKYNVGVAQTWDEAYENAIKVRDQSNGKTFYMWTYSFPFDMDPHVLWEMWNFGVFPLEKLHEGEVGLNTPEARVWLEWRRKMAKGGLIPGKGETISATRTVMFPNEQLVLAPDIVMIKGDMERTNPKRWGDNKVLDGTIIANPFPTVNKGDTQVVPIHTVTLAISSQSEVKEEAWKFAYWFSTSQKVAEGYLWAAGGMAPSIRTQKKMLEKGGFYDNPYYASALKQMKYLRRAPVNEHWSTGAKLVIDAANKAVYTDEPIDDILEQTEATIKIVTGMK